MECHVSPYLLPDENQTNQFELVEQDVILPLVSVMMKDKPCSIEGGSGAHKAQCMARFLQEFHSP
jgi:hypothetical protein